MGVVGCSGCGCGQWVCLWAVGVVVDSGCGCGCGQ